MRWFKSMPFKFRLSASFLLVAALPLLFCAFLMARILDSSLSHQTAREGELQLHQMKSRLSAAAGDCLAVCQSMNEENAVALSLLDNKTVDNSQKDSYLFLYQAVQNTSGHPHFSVYDAGGRLRFTTKDVHPRESRLPLYWGLLQMVPSDRQLVLYATDPYLSAGDDILLQAAYPLDLGESGARTGYLVMDFTRAALDWIFGGYHSDRDILILADPRKSPVYCSNPELTKEEVRNLLFSADETGKSRAPSVWAQEPDTGFYLFLKKAAPISASVFQAMQAICILLTLAVLAVSLFMSLLLSRSISRPVSILDTAMKKVRKGDLSVQIHLNRSDELGRLGESFNQMTARLQENIQREVDRQKALNETMLRLYQTQLNPHFLCNTLDTIKWSARMQNNTEIPVLAENLAVILRQSISSRPFITLGEELETIANYVEIQKIRFSGRFIYETEVPDQLETCLVPKMILQPLVENAILHGLEGQTDGYICVFACQEEYETLRIAVTDDGCGMSREMIGWINSGSPERMEGHLGLYNVIQILKLYYGQEYGLHADADPDGTTVSITLPLERRESSV
ncbi:MAG: sensor histidine kinase [Eubacteriales bacterium]|nr:sensor histidine kinase [Eubacteriales bacterium]